MAGKDIPAAGAALSADGDANGTLTIASTTSFRVGSRGNVSSTTTAGVEVIVTEITDATHLKVKVITPQRTNVSTVPIAGDGGALKLNPISYGTSSMAAYLLADSARLDCPRQFIYNEPV